MYFNTFNAVKLFCYTIFCMGFFVEANSQNQTKVDSLIRVIDTVGEEQLRLQGLVELSLEYFEHNNHLCLQYADQAHELALSIGDSLIIVKSARIMGQMYRRLGDLNKSMQFLNEAYPIAKRNNFIYDYKRILNALAAAYILRADYDKALEFNFQSLLLREQEGDKAEISIALNNIGLVYFKLKNYEQAIKYYLKSMDYKNSSGNNIDLDKLLINLGLCYNQIGEFSQAQKYILQGFETCLGSCDPDLLAEGKFALGVSYYMQKEYTLAEINFRESYVLAASNENKRFEIENLVYLGELSAAQKKFNEAKKYFLEAEAKAKPIGYSQLLIDTYLHYSKMLNNLQQFEEAAVYQQKYIALKDSLFNEELVKNIAKVQTNYAERENIATIASNEIVIKQSRELSVAIAVIALLAGLLVLVLQFGNRNIKRVNAKLSEAKEVIQEKNQELANKNRELDFQVEKKTADLAKANSSLKQVNDELDNFIYKTSHDIRGPLASLKGMCNVALMDVTDPTALDYLRKLDATAERLNTILTRLVIINQINNSKLTIEHIDFDGIVSDVLLLERKKGVPQELLIIPQIDRDATIESDKELVRIVLENLIDNAIKFYNDSDRVKSFVKIYINSMPKGGVIVRVIDNGIGISESSPGKLFQMFSRASERSETGGIGLYITKTATEKIGGKVGLLTTPEGYTEFYVIFPPHPFNESERMLRASSF